RGHFSSDVGVGLINPTARLHVTGVGSSGLSLNITDNLFVDPGLGFVGVGRSGRVTGAEYFGVQAPVTSGYGGMYVQTAGGSALPFYGYSAGGTRAWTYLNGSDQTWRVNNNGDRLTVGAAGYVGIGTTSPQSSLHVLGPGNPGSGLADGVHIGRDTSSNARIELVTNVGTPYIDFSNGNVADHNARIILYNDPTEALAIEVNKVGIGTMVVPSGAKLQVLGGHGIEATADFPSGHALKGTATGADGRGLIASGARYGVWADAIGSEGTAVYARATAESGDTEAVYGSANSSSGVGVYGFAGAFSGTNWGVYGMTNSSSEGYGVYSVGRFAATGTKSFQIDHPLDPANRYLNHYCTEGPEPLFIYRGNALLDDRGEGWVELPDYFESMNRDFHYQLTCVGAFAPVYVGEEIKGNRFKIAGGRAGLKVCWTVTGARNDPFVRAYGAPVEQEKPEEYRGRYLHPELYGQPQEANVHHARQTLRERPADRREGAE
ncbi:MAG: hypothetical protein AAB363_08305, partial [Planctomycetota bacterium]